MNLLNISCKKATYLVSKKEESRLSWLERIQLRGHMTICSFCRKFEQQTGFIGRMIGHDHVHATLTPETKQKMQEALLNEPS
ncbi:MAG: zf-HC2 domain-containing protein [Bacteroidota bacterium]